MYYYIRLVYYRTVYRKYSAFGKFLICYIHSRTSYDYSSRYYMRTYRVIYIYLSNARNRNSKTKSKKITYHYIHTHKCNYRRTVILLYIGHTAINRNTGDENIHFKYIMKRAFRVKVKVRNSFVIYQ